jgi:hypothetical protein
MERCWSVGAEYWSVRISDWFNQSLSDGKVVSRGDSWVAALSSYFGCGCFALVTCDRATFRRAQISKSANVFFESRTRLDSATGNCAHYEEWVVAFCDRIRQRGVRCVM